MDQARYRWYLDELTRWAGAHPSVIGLVTLGSAAGRSHAPDEWSDHDVWVVTLEGTAAPFRNDPSWLPDAESIIGWFVETAHGRSAVYEDGHLVEVAIFEDPELELARANDFRVLYDRGGIEVRLERIAANTAAEGGNQADLAAGRFLVEMIIGLGRLGRGELLSAGELIRGRAVASLLRLEESTSYSMISTRCDGSRWCIRLSPSASARACRCHSWMGHSRSWTLQRSTCPERC